MPSDAKKKQAQKKKDAAKVRQGGKKPTTTRAEDGDKESSPVSINGSTVENGSTEISAEGNDLRNSYRILSPLLIKTNPDVVFISAMYSGFKIIVHLLNSSRVKGGIKYFAATFLAINFGCHTGYSICIWTRYAAFLLFYS